MKNFGMDGRNNTRATSLPHVFHAGAIMHFPTCRSFRFNRSANEGGGSSDRRYRGQRFVPNGRPGGYDRTENRHAVWSAFRRAHRRKTERALGLFLAATRPWSSSFTPRVESSRQHLRVALAECALDHRGHGG